MIFDLFEFIVCIIYCHYIVTVAHNICILPISLCTQPNGDNFVFTVRISLYLGKYYLYF